MKQFLARIESEVVNENRNDKVWWEEAKNEMLCGEYLFTILYEL